MLLHFIDSSGTRKDLELPKFSVIVGENGSGKSRLLSQIKQIQIGNSLLPEPDRNQPRKMNPFQNFKDKIILKNFNDLFLDFSQPLHLTTQQSQHVEDPFHKTVTEHQASYIGLRESIRYRNYQRQRGDIPETPLESEAEFVKDNGKEPFEIANQLLAEADLKLRLELDTPAGALMFHYPTPGRPKTHIVKLGPNNIKSAPYAVTDLSSGEKVILGLALIALENRAKKPVTPKIILLDEIDAVLHPNAIPNMLKAIKNVLVNQLDLHVILTTHSPTTVALAEEDSLFLMRDGTPVPEKVTKSAALTELTKSIPVLIDYSQTRFVICENESDAEVFRTLVQKEVVLPNPTRQLVFIGAGNSVEGKTGGKDAVKSLVKSFSDAGNQTVCGLIDFDKGKEANSDKILVLGHGQRDGIENALFDPFLLLALIVSEANGNLGTLGLPSSFGMSDLVKASAGEVQVLVDKLQDMVLGHGNSNEKVQMVGYCHRPKSEFTLKLREKWLLEDDHKLEELIGKNLLPKFPALEKFTNSETKGKKMRALRKPILNEVLRNNPGLLPIVFRETFEKLIAMKLHSDPPPSPDAAAAPH